jgi:hypothetical protein
MFTALAPRARFHFNVLSGHAPPRVVFMHIPKCGGTSINHHFKSNFGGSRTGRSLLLDSVIGNAADPEALQRARKSFYVAGHFGWSTLQQVAGGAYTVTVLREPFSRLRALYNFARKPRRIAHPIFARLAETAAKMEFEEFCLCDEPDIRAMTDNAITRTLAHDYFPLDSNGLSQQAALARDHLEGFDMIADVGNLSGVLPRLALATRTELIHGESWRNETSRQTPASMSRSDFLADSKLHARIAHDLEVYEHAKTLMT